MKAVVTGGTRGIGFAIAEKLLSDGIEVIATGTGEEGSVPSGTNYFKVNFLDDQSTASFVNFLAEANIDILINNAGINKIEEFSEIALQDFDQILQVNLRAPFQLCQAVVPYMKQNNWGRIVNISSIFGNIVKEYRASYCASKFGLEGMTAAFAAELSEFGILANCVAPGFIDTDLTHNILGESGINKLKTQIPAKRLGTVEEIAALVSWLVSRENSYLTGQTIIADGGFSRV